MRFFRPTRLLVLAAVLTTAGAACASAAFAQAAASDDPPAPHVSAITVSGRHLEVNGVPWVPRGVQIVGLVAPQASLSGKYLTANQHYSPSELGKAASDGADVIRFQVSEFGLDPQNQLYSPAYVQEVESAIQSARSQGLAVIISLQAEPPAGEPTRCPLPDAGAERVWQELAPVYAGDRGVMFELYNEPAVSATALGWQEWLVGGEVTNGAGTCVAVGMQQLIDDIRAAGANNVIVVPGVEGEQTLGGMPALNDPSNPSDPQLAYGIHYPSPTKGTTGWDNEFGDTSGTAPVIVTEWHADASQSTCTPQVPAQTQLLLDYLSTKQIGIVGYSFDVPGTIIADWSYDPTTFSNFQCGVLGGGPGQVLFNEFASEASVNGGFKPAPLAAWTISGTELKRLVANDAGTAQRAFDTPQTFVTGAGSASLIGLSIAEAIPTASFTDERKLPAALRNNTLPAGTEAVLYDDEPVKSLTPRDQQLHPAKYFQTAAALIHARGLLMIAGVGPGLVATISPHTKLRDQEAKFLKLAIVTQAARYTDAFELEASALETQSGRFAAFARGVAHQALKVNPGVELLGALSTNQGPEVQSTVLLRAVFATQKILTGFALIDPARSSACPLCTGPYTSVLLKFLRGFRTQSSQTTPTTQSSRAGKRG